MLSDARVHSGTHRGRPPRSGVKAAA
jgi:hypothetical protein